MRRVALLLAVASASLSGCPARPDSDVPVSTATIAVRTTADPDAEPRTPPSLLPPPPDRGRYIGGFAWIDGGRSLLVYCAEECKTDRLPAYFFSPDAGTTRVDIVDKLGGESVRLVAASPRGGFVAGSIGDRLVVVSAQGEPVHTIERPGIYHMFAFSPDEGTLAWANAFGSLHLVDLAKKTDTAVASMHDPNASDMVTLTWSPKGGHVLVSEGHGNPPAVLDVKSKRLKKLGSAPGFAAFVSAGDEIVVATEGGFVGLFDAKTGAARATLRKASPPKNDEPPVPVSAALSHDAKKLVVASTDLVVFDLATKKPTTILGKLEASFPATTRISPSGAEIAIDTGTDVLVIDTSIATAPPRVAETNLVGYAADGTLILVDEKNVLSGFRKGDAVWSAKLPEPPSEVAFSPDLEVLAVAVAGRLRIVRPSDGKTVVVELRPTDAGIAVVPIGVTKKEDVEALLRKN